MRDQNYASLVWGWIDMAFVWVVEIDSVFVYGGRKSLILVGGLIDLVFVWVVEVGLVFVSEHRI